MKYTRVRLTNGSKLGIVNTPGSYTASIAAFVRAGFKYDPINKPGLAHFTEHMLFDGSKRYPSTADLSWAVERFGGWHYAFTWIEHQQHLIHLPKDNLEQGVQVLTDLLINPLLDPNEFNREKGMIKEEILRNRSDPEKAILDYAWQPLFFKGTSLARPYSGTEADIDRISLEDVREFLNNHFLPESTAFLVVGDLDVGKTTEIFENNIAGYSRKGGVHDLSKASLKVSEASLRVKSQDNRSQRIGVYPYKTEQIAMTLGIKTTAFNNKDKYKLNLIQDILGGYYGARLPLRLRDEGGLIYSWNMWQDNLSDTGYLIFKSSTAAKNVYKLAEVLLQEYNDLARNGIKEEELGIAKGHAIGSLFCNTQTGFDFVNWYGIQELMTDEVISLEQQAEIYKNISAKNILDTAQKYFAPENIYLAILGNADQSKIAKIMKSN